MEAEVEAENPTALDYDAYEDKGACASDQATTLGGAYDALAPAEKVASGSLIPGFRNDDSRTSDEDRPPSEATDSLQDESNREQEETNSEVDEEEGRRPSDDDSTPGAS